MLILYHRDKTYQRKKGAGTERDVVTVHVGRGRYIRPTRAHHAVYKINIT
jgi:hypothetical protein